MDPIHDDLLRLHSPPTVDLSAGEVRDAERDPSRTRGKYVLAREIGHGGFGVVWLAWDRELQRSVAIKVLNAEGLDDLDRFLREARAAARLSHPNIVAVHDVGEDRGDRYIVMEFVDGRSADRAALDAAGAVEVVRQIADAIEYAHAQGIAHRDLKPANILVTPGPPLRARVTDFGLAKRLAGDEAGSFSGEIKGTPAFLTPEVVRGAAGRPAFTADELRRIDVYGLGATLLALVTGRPPFEGGDLFEIMRKVVEEDPRLDHPSMSRDLRTVAAQATAKDPARRYASAAALRDDLARLQAGDPVLARRVGPLERTWRRVRRRPVAFALALAGLALGAWFAGDLFQRRGIERAERARELIARAERATSASSRASLLAEARRLLDDAPDRPRVEHARGLLALAEGRPADAVEAFSRALEVDPDLDAARWDRGRARVELASMLDVDTRLRRAERSRRQVELAALAAEDLAAGGWDAIDPGERAYLELLSAYARGDSIRVEGALAGDARAWVLLGNAQRRARLESLGSYDRALALDPASAPAYFHRGADLLLLGRPAEAESDCTRAIELMPMLAEARYNRALARQRLGRLAEAIEDYDALLAMRPDILNGLFNRAVARREAGDPRGALADLELYLRRAPEDAEAFDERGAARLALGDADAAMEDFGRAIAWRPDLASAWFHQGVVRTDRGDLEGAADDYTRALEADPSFARAAYNRGNLRVGGGDADGAIEDYTRAVEADPAYAAAWYNRGVAFESQGRPDEALADYRRAVDARPDYAEALHNAAAILQARGEVDEAIEGYSRAIEADPRFWASRYNRAMARAEAGDATGAVEDLDRLLEEAPVDWPQRPAAELLRQVLEQP